MEKSGKIETELNPRMKGRVELPVQTPIVTRRGQKTQLFTSEFHFSYVFDSQNSCSFRYTASMYYEPLTYDIITRQVIEKLRRVPDLKHKIQIEVYASWIVEGQFYEKLMRELPISDKDKKLADIIQNAVRYLWRTGPLGKRTPEDFRDEDRSWKMYTDEHGVRRLRLCYEYEKIRYR